MVVDQPTMVWVQSKGSRNDLPEVPGLEAHLRRCQGFSGKPSGRDGWPKGVCVFSGTLRVIQTEVVGTTYPVFKKMVIQGAMPSTSMISQCRLHEHCTADWG